MDNSPNDVQTSGPTLDDSFELYDLRVEVVLPHEHAGEPTTARILCNARVGDWFEVRGELLHFPPGQAFSMYSLAALLPLLPAKQRPTHAHDWMSSDAEVACPDPHCPTRFRITRLGLRRFSHAQSTAVPLPSLSPSPSPSPSPAPSASASASPAQPGSP